MDHVLITRRLTKLPSAAARPFMWFAALFMSGVIAGLHLMSGLRRFRPGGSASSATVTPDAGGHRRAGPRWAGRPIGLADTEYHTELADTGLADTGLVTAEQTPPSRPRRWLSPR